MTASRGSVHSGVTVVSASRGSFHFGVTVAATPKGCHSGVTVIAAPSSVHAGVTVVAAPSGRRKTPASPRSGPRYTHDIRSTYLQTLARCDQVARHLLWHATVVSQALTFQQPLRIPSKDVSLVFPHRLHGCRVESQTAVTTCGHQEDKSNEFEHGRQHRAPLGYFNT